MRSRRVDATTPDLMRSPRTLPAPTDGSWSVSPTHVTDAPDGMAARRSSARLTSTIDVSSNMNTSPSSRFSSLKVKRLVTGFHLRSRCTVIAGAPTDSAMRFAARPVGAARTTLRRRAEYISTRARMIVVLPTPGPPVIIEKRFPRQRASAADCCAASVKPARRSHHGIAFSASIGGKADGLARMRRTCVAVWRSAQ